MYGVVTGADFFWLRYSLLNWKYQSMASLTDIKTIVIVMMENRSFDHMLGYLSLAPFNRPDVEGQSLAPGRLAKAENSDGPNRVLPFHSQDPYSLPHLFDPPHGRNDIKTHLGPLDAGKYAMSGFVKALPTKVTTDPEVRKLVMAYFGAEEVPTSHFFAKEFTICDNWFCSLPAGTQPNRLMAMSGFSNIDENAVPLPNQALVYDWLKARGVTWRVYHEGIPFFTMMPKWVLPILEPGGNFRDFKEFEADIRDTPPDDLPQVIFIEPVYGDSPHLGRATDDHAPSGVSDGQEFLMQVYNAVRTPGFWETSLTIVMYDEHGGFFDHVSPPLIPTKPPAGITYDNFESLGVRTPAFIISPFVKPGFVAKNLFDHTSVLKLLGERFRDNSYSDIVDSRPVASASAALDFTNPIIDAPAAPNLQAYFSKKPPTPTGATIPPGDTELQKAFLDAVDKMKQNGAGPDHEKFGELIQAMDSQQTGAPGGTTI